MCECNDYEDWDDVEIDQQAMQAFRVMCERSYCDSEPVYNMSDATESFDEYQESYIYRSVA